MFNCLSFRCWLLKIGCCLQKRGHFRALVSSWTSWLWSVQIVVLALIRANVITSPNLGYVSDQTEDQTMGMGHTKETENQLWLRPNESTVGYDPDQTDCWLDMNHNNQNKYGVWARSNIPNSNTARQNRPTTVYLPDQLYSTQVWAKRE